MRIVVRWGTRILGGGIVVVGLMVGISAWMASVLVKAESLPSCCAVVVRPDPTPLVASGEPPGDRFTHLFTGGQHTLSDWSDEPFLLVFFASQCAACVEEAPALLEAQQGGVPVLLVNATDTVTAGRSWVSQFALGLPAGRLEAGSRTLQERGIFTLPTVVLVDASATEIRRWQGRVSAMELINGWTEATTANGASFEKAR